MEIAVSDSLVDQEMHGKSPFRLTVVRGEFRRHRNKSVYFRHSACVRGHSRRKIGIGISPGATSGSLTRHVVCLNRRGFKSL